ncbi:hypothetical protein HYU11_01985 [Candidatus Woesearchaeota archaeon]|nr:hypothetical protein [Candidatus Woesearchaeota archaeon]
MDDIKQLLSEFLSKKSEKAPETQTPAAFSILCSDSRIQSVDFLSQPHNNLFVSRNIGNQSIGFLGSAAYPIEHLHSIRLAVVVGHVGCGAVGAAYKLAKNQKREFEPRDFEHAVEATLESARGKKKSLMTNNCDDAVSEDMNSMAFLFAHASDIIGKDSEPYLPKYSEANVHLQVAGLLQLGLIRKKVESGSLVVCGAVYDFFGKYGDEGRSHLVNVNGGRPETFKGINLRRFF